VAVDSVASDHTEVRDHAACRRYFAKFEKIIGHLRSAIADEPLEHGMRGPVAGRQTKVLEGYLNCLGNTFTALSYKHLVTGLVSNQLPKALEIDRRESGFPVFSELLQMANDAAQTATHLDTLPSKMSLKAEMVDHILRQQEHPRDLQYAMSQRVYYERLRDGPLFLTQNHAQIFWLANTRDGRRNYMIHWAAYDSQTNLPTVYILVLEDSGSLALGPDEKRWPRLQSHLSAQSISGLKLLTIAQGIDQDFRDIHPKVLRRIRLGPMYSHTFTNQTGPLRDILAEADGEPGLDWIFGWTVETLISKGTETKSTGLFGSTNIEIFDLDPARRATDAGATRVETALMLPLSAYQILADQYRDAFKGTRKYVVGPQGTVIAET